MFFKLFLAFMLIMWAPFLIVSLILLAKAFLSKNIEGSLKSVERVQVSMSLVLIVVNLLFFGDIPFIFILGCVASVAVMLTLLVPKSTIRSWLDSLWNKPKV